MKHIFLFCFFIVLAITISFIFDVSAVSGEKEIDVNVRVVSDNDYELTNDAGNDAEGNYIGLNELDYNEEAVSSSVERRINPKYNSAAEGLASYRVSNTFFVPIALINVLFVLIIGNWIFKRKKKAKRKRR